MLPGGRAGEFVGDDDLKSQRMFSGILEKNMCLVPLSAPLASHKFPLDVTGP